MVVNVVESALGKERTGSHPFVELNPRTLISIVRLDPTGIDTPVVLQPGLEPEATSLKASVAKLYMSGLMNPRGGFRFAIRKSFNNENIPATV